VTVTWCWIFLEVSGSLFQDGRFSCPTILRKIQWEDRPVSGPFTLSWILTSYSIFHITNFVSSLIILNINSQKLAFHIWQFKRDLYRDLFAQSRIVNIKFRNKLLCKLFILAHIIWVISYQSYKKDWPTDWPLSKTNVVKNSRLLVGVRTDSEIYQNFRIFEKFWGHRVRHQKKCSHAKFESIGSFQGRKIATDIFKIWSGKSIL